MAFPVHIEAVTLDFLFLNVGIGGDFMKRLFFFCLVLFFGQQVFTEEAGLQIWELRLAIVAQGQFKVELSREIEASQILPRKIYGVSDGKNLFLRVALPENSLPGAKWYAETTRRKFSPTLAETAQLKSQSAELYPIVIDINSILDTGFFRYSVNDGTENQQIILRSKNKNGRDTTAEFLNLRVSSNAVNGKELARRYSEGHYLSTWETLETHFRISGGMQTRLPNVIFADSRGTVGALFGFREDTGKWYPLLGYLKVLISPPCG